jgi:anion-transporting  ArsA/GET3 family ATPase
MEAGFRERAARVLELLEADSTSFLLVTSPRRDAVDEAEYFAARLAEMDTPVDALVVNRVHPRFGEGNAAALRSRATTLRALDGAGDRLARWYENLSDFREVAEHEHQQFEPVIERMPGAAVAFVPYLARDVHDFEALHEVGTHLFAPAEGGR